MVNTCSSVQRPKKIYSYWLFYLVKKPNIFSLLSYMAKMSNQSSQFENLEVVNVWQFSLKKDKG